MQTALANSLLERSLERRERKRKRKEQHIDTHTHTHDREKKMILIYPMRPVSLFTIKSTALEHIWDGAWARSQFNIPRFVFGARNRDNLVEDIHNTPIGSTPYLIMFV